MGCVFLCHLRESVADCPCVVGWWVVGFRGGQGGTLRTTQLCLAITGTSRL